LADAKEKDRSRYVSEEDLETMIKRQTFPSPHTVKTIGNRVIHYQKSSKKFDLTIFGGGHEILRSVALDLIDSHN
jgi:hypothetical protein